MPSSLDHLSYSQVNMWLRCPRQWEYRYIKGMKLPPSGAMVQGGAYHEALALNFTEKLKGIDLPLSDVLDSYDTAWNNRFVEEEGDHELAQEIDWRGEDPGRLKDEGATLVKYYHDKIAPKIEPVLVEERLELSIDGFNFVGIVDLTTKAGTVIDHKVAGKSKTQEDVDKDLQPSAYSLLLQRPIDFAFHVALKVKNPTVQFIGTHRDQKDTDWFCGLIKEVKKGIDAGVAPPNPNGWHCSEKWCGYWQLCRR